MSLAHAYAKVIQDSETAIPVDRVLAYMKARGHLSLLTRIVKILERTPDTDRAVLIVANKRDAEKHMREVVNVGGDPKNTKVVVDPQIVGNYIVRKKEKLIDASYRKQLVELYQHTVT